MSQTIAQNAVDTYLAQQVAPPQKIELDPQYGSIRMVTPIGRFAYVTLMKPKAVKQPDGSMGAEQYSLTLLLRPESCGDLYNAVCAVANNRWPSEQKPDPQNPNVMKNFTGAELLFIDPRMGGLHYPLRSGDESYMRDPVKFGVWRGLFFINTSVAATNAKTGASTAPVCKDENGRDCRPDVFYSGCYGRLQVTLFAYPKPGTQGRGSRGVGVALNAVQFARHGERLAGFDASKAAADAFGAAGAIAPDPTAPQPQIGYGPNTGSAGSVPPGGVAPGFAAPVQSGFAAPPQQMAPGGFVPPQQPQAPSFAGARPPGA